jgi:hypothetical protein
MEVSEGCRTTHCDQHASALKPGAAASEESHDEDDHTDCNADAVSTDHAVLWEQLGISRVGQAKPDTHAQDPAATQLKRNSKQFSRNHLSRARFAAVGGPWQSKCGGPFQYQQICVAKIVFDVNFLLLTKNTNKTSLHFIEEHISIKSMDSISALWIALHD